MATFEIESNDTSGTATSIGSLSSNDTTILETGGQLKSAGDKDYFKFTVTDAVYVDWSFDSPVTVDDTTDTADSFGIIITNSSGTEIAHYYTDDDIEGTFAALTAGSYYVYIESAGNYTEDYGHSLQYGLQLSVSEDFAETESNDTTGTADEANFGRYYHGQIGTAIDIDTFEYEVEDEGLVSIDFDSPWDSADLGGDFYKISVLSPSGTTISTFYTDTDITSFDFYADTIGSYFLQVTRATFWGAEDYRIRATAAASTTTGSESTAIEGGSGADNLTGTEADDIIDGLTDADRMAGGLGNDYYYIDDKKDKIMESSSEGTDTIESAIDLVLFANVEKLILASTATKGTGNELDNSIVGNELINKLYGMSGDDMLDGGSGADKMYGGSGDDIYYVDDSKDKITEARFAGDDTVYASVDILTWYTGTENLILVDTTVQAIGDAQDNTVHGNDSFNHIEGKGGDDTLYGEGGNDDIRGGTGNDVLEGGDGSDVFVFDAKLSAESNLDEITDFEVNSDKLWLSKNIFGKLAKGALSDSYFYEYSGTPSAQDSNDFLIYDTDTSTLYYDADGSGSGEAIAFVVADGISASDILII